MAFTVCVVAYCHKVKFQSIYQLVMDDRYQLWIYALSKPQAYGAHTVIDS